MAAVGRQRRRPQPRQTERPGTSLQLHLEPQGFRARRIPVTRFSAGLSRAFNTCGRFHGCALSSPRHSGRQLTLAKPAPVPLWPAHARGRSGSEGPLHFPTRSALHGCGEVACAATAARLLPLRRVTVSSTEFGERSPASCSRPGTPEPRPSRVSGGRTWRRLSRPARSPCAAPVALPGPAPDRRTRPRFR